jgi:hypothetical protein
LPKECARHVFHLAFEADSDDFVKLAEAVLGMTPAEILGEASWPPFFRLGHIHA